jgi:hypothetical protein
MLTKVTSSFLKLAMMGGPVVLYGAFVSLAIFGTAIWDGEGHKDVLVLIAMSLLVLVFVEWSLARRFTEHERVEVRERQVVIAAQQETYKTLLMGALEPLRAEMNRMVMVFDGNASSYDKQYLEFQKLREGVEQIKTGLEKLTSLNLEERLSTVERVLKLKP